MFAETIGLSFSSGQGLILAKYQTALITLDT